MPPCVRAGDFPYDRAGATLKTIHVLGTFAEQLNRERGTMSQVKPCPGQVGHPQAAPGAILIPCLNLLEGFHLSNSLVCHSLSPAPL